MVRHHWERAVAVAAGMAAVAAAGSGLTAAAPASGLAASAAARPVSARPAAGTPQILRTGNVTERVRQLVQCGSSMYAVGSFAWIGWHGRAYRRSNIFRFRAIPPFTVSRWNPGVNGVVNTIAFSGGHCAGAYIGGRFTSVHGRAAHDIAEISTRTGAVVAAFGRHASGQVETLVSSRGRLIAGGYFTRINGSAADPYLASLNPVTGADDGYLHLRIAGHYQFRGADANTTRVYNQQLSHNGRLDLVEGDFTVVGGRPRQQVFMLRLGPARASVTGWTSALLRRHCVINHPFYVEGGAWSPSDSTVYLATTGYHPLGWHGHFPLTGLCDATVAFPARPAAVTPKWVNYTGCWSLYTVTASSAAVYIGGHEEYADNRDGCKSAGPGAVAAPGLGALYPARGRALLNPKRTAGRYSRSRGAGADDLLLTRAGLWVASDNGILAGGRFHLSDTCGGIGDHAGICFLPYRSGP